MAKSSRAPASSGGTISNTYRVGIGDGNDGQPGGGRALGLSHMEGRPGTAAKSAQQKKAKRRPR